MGDLIKNFLILSGLVIFSLLFFIGCGLPDNNCVNVDGDCSYDDSRDYSETDNWEENNDWNETNTNDSYNDETVNENNDNTY